MERVSETIHGEGDDGELKPVDLSFHGDDDSGAAEGETDEFGRSLELLSWRPKDILRVSAEELHACQELFRRGDISWLLHPAQAKLLDWLELRRRDIAVVCCSRQIGKSFLLLAYAVAYCLSHPKHTVLYVAPHLQQLDKIVFPRINSIFQWLPEDCVPNCRAGERWSFANGAVLRIDGVSVGRGVRIRGDTVHLCIIDEARDIVELETLVASHLSPMLTTTDAHLGIVMISTPPESPAHAFTDRFIREALQRGDFYSLNYKSNPLLSTRRLRVMVNTLYPGGENNPVFRREFLADYTVADVEKRVVREWNETINDQFFADYRGPQGPVRGYIGLDYGYADPAGILAGWFDPVAGAIVIQDEWFHRNMTTADVGQKVLDMEKRLMEQLPKGSPDPYRILDIDPGLMNDLYTMYGLRFEPINKINSSIAMMNRLRISVAEGKVRIHPRCTQLRFQLKVGCFNSKGTDYVRTEKTGHLDLIESLKGIVLNCRFSELSVNNDGGAAALRYNQMRVGFVPLRGGFKAGIINRPA